MNPQSPNQPPVDPPCNTIVYRTIRRKDWFDPDDNTRVKAEAFMRRKPTRKSDGSVDPGDDDGLSLFDSFHVGVDECIEAELSCHGLATLHVGTLRDLGLTVIRDPENHKKVLVVDMPLVNPNDAVQEALADAVAESARIGSRRRWKKPS